MASAPDHHHRHDQSASPAAAALDPATESLSSALRSGFNVLRLIMIVLLVAYFFSGWVSIGPGQQGVIIRFGELRTNPASAEEPAVFDQGWYAALPDPFDEKIILSGEQRSLTVDTFLFARPPAEQGKPLEAAPARDDIDPAVDGSMMTGDRGLVHGRWAIGYVIADAEQFVRHIGDDEAGFEVLLRRLLEKAVVRTVASISAERVLSARTTNEGALFTEAVKDRLARDMDRFQTGIEIKTVTANVFVPGDVRVAFLDVTNAQSDFEQKRGEADKLRVQILTGAAGDMKKQVGPLLAAIDRYGAAQTADADEARLVELRAQIDQRLDAAGGAVAVRLAEARARADQSLQRIRKEFEEFTYYRAAWLANPRETILRLWVDMRTAVLGSKQNELFYVPPGGQIEIITNRDEQKLIDQDIESFRERRRSGG